jgi:hypothetical protein
LSSATTSPSTTVSSGSDARVFVIPGYFPLKSLSFRDRKSVSYEGMTGVVSLNLMRSEDTHED